MIKIFDYSFLHLMVKTQWRDRISTSAFLVGISIQTFLLSLAIFTRSTTTEEALTLAIRTSCFTSIGILLFSAMSSIQNEFRFGTIDNVLTGARGLNELVTYRALATALISSPAILAPFIAAWLGHQGEISIFFLITLATMVYVFVFSLCYQLSFLINLFSQPSLTIPIIKFLVIMTGLRFMPGGWSIKLSLILPSGWILALARHEFSLPLSCIGFYLSIVGSTAAVNFFVRPLVESGIEKRLINGRSV